MSNIRFDKAGATMTDMFDSKTLCATCGCLGLIGASIVLGGDALLYAHAGPTLEIPRALSEVLGPREPILLASHEHLMWSSVAGAIGAFFYMFGAVHTYLNLAPASKFWAAVSALLLALLLVIVGAYHAMFCLWGLTLQHALVEGTGLDLAKDVMQSLRLMMDVMNFVSVPLSASTLVMIAAGKTNYPRWILAIHPIIVYAPLQAAISTVAPRLPQPLAAMMLGGSFNALWVIYFAASMKVASAYPAQELPKHHPYNVET